MHVSVFVCMVYACVEHVCGYRNSCANLENRGQGQVPFSITLHLIFEIEFLIKHGVTNELEVFVGKSLGSFVFTWQC